MAPTAKTLIEAQNDTIDKLSKRISDLEGVVDKHDSKTQNVIVGVLIAAVLVVATVATEVILSNRIDRQLYTGLNQNISDQNETIHMLELRLEDTDNRFQMLRAMNKYLK